MKHTYLALLSVLLLTACGTFLLPTPTPTSVPTATATLTPSPTVTVTPTPTATPTPEIDRLDGGVGVQLAPDGSVEKIWPPMGMSEIDEKTFFDQFDVESMGVKDKVKLVYADRFLRYVDVNDPTIIHAEWQKFENGGYMYWNYKEQLVRNMLADNCEVAPEGVLSKPDYGIHADNQKGMDYMNKLGYDGKNSFFDIYLAMRYIGEKGKNIEGKMEYFYSDFRYPKVLIEELNKPARDVAPWVVDVIIKGFDNGQGWFVCRKNKGNGKLFVLPAYGVEISYENMMGYYAKKYK